MSKSDAQIQRESDARIKKAEKATLPPTHSGAGGIADWNNADSGALLRLVCLVGMQGGAVRFGYTRDGGAYSIGIYIDDDKSTYYCNEKEGINVKLQELTEFFEK